MIKKSIFKTLKGKPSSAEKGAAKEKRSNLIEEYKILQTKIDVYGSVLIRFRGIMISLLSAIVFFSFNASVNEILIKTIILLVASYALYYEFITEKARGIFQKRIILIEEALKNKSIFNQTEIFSISKESSKIKPGIRVFLIEEALKAKSVLIQTRIFSFFKDRSKIRSETKVFLKEYKNRGSWNSVFLPILLLIIVLIFFPMKKEDSRTYEPVNIYFQEKNTSNENNPKLDAIKQAEFRNLVKADISFISEKLNLSLEKIDKFNDRIDNKYKIDNKVISDIKFIKNTVSFNNEKLMDLDNCCYGVTDK